VGEVVHLPRSRSSPVPDRPGGRARIAAAVEERLAALRVGERAGAEPDGEGEEDDHPPHPCPLTEPPNISADDRVGRVAEFRIALQRFERTSDQVVRRSGLTPRQHLLLLALEGRHAGSASIGTLSRELLLAQSTVTELADRAQAEGLVERVVARDDARVVLVRTTREGARQLERALAALDRERDRLGLAIGDLDAAFPRVSDPASPPRARGRASDR